MPELPEVETIKRGLAKAIVGKRIADVKVLEKKSFKGEPKEIIGKIVKSVQRRAKLLIIGLGNNVAMKQCSNETMFLVIHLKMTGQLVYRQEVKSQKLKVKSKEKRSPFDVDQLPNKYTRAVITFDDGRKLSFRTPMSIGEEKKPSLANFGQTKLYFNDLRKFGWMKAIKSKVKSQKSKIDEIIGEELGPEPFSKEFSVDYLKKILSRWGRPVKLLLMEQKKIAGVGNIYANEALFCARIAPHHRGRDLVKDHPEKVAKLYECLKKVLNEGLKYDGSSASDEAYRKINGTKGEMQEHFKVYQREGQECPNRCGQKIRRMTLAGRGTFFCPRCQK